VWQTVATVDGKVQLHCTGTAATVQVILFARLTVLLCSTNENILKEVRSTAVSNEQSARQRSICVPRDAEAGVSKGERW
jgi:hypothetical protein